MSQQFVVVAYDISNDKRRTKLHNVLLDYGTPVQYSVFECLLEGEQLAQMKQAVARVIRPRKDQVRYYHLCQQCLSRTEITSGPQVLHETDVIVV